MKNKIKKLQTQFEQIKLEQYRLLNELAKKNTPVVACFKGDGEWDEFKGNLFMLNNGDLIIIDEREDERIIFTQSQLDQLNYDEDNDKIYVIVDLDD